MASTKGNLGAGMNQADALLMPYHMKLSPAQERAIARRWKSIAPWYEFTARTVEMMCGDTVEDRMERYRIRHRIIVMQCFSLRIPWASIRRGSLDNPVATDDELSRSLRAAGERRRVRMGRVKGARKDGRPSKVHASEVLMTTHLREQVFVTN